MSIYYIGMQIIFQPAVAVIPTHKFRINSIQE